MEMTYFKQELYNITIFVIASAILSLILLAFVYLISYSSKVEIEKSSAYECGFTPFSETNFPFEVQFALIAIMFLLFDIEVLYLFPLIQSIITLNSTELIYIIIFFAIVLISLIYEISRNLLRFTPSINKTTVALAANPFLAFAANIEPDNTVEGFLMKEAAMKLMSLVSQNMSFSQCAETLKHIHPEWILDIETYKSVYLQVNNVMPTDILLHVPLDTIGIIVGATILILGVASIIAVIYVLYKVETTPQVPPVKKPVPYSSNYSANEEISGIEEHVETLYNPLEIDLYNLLYSLNIVNISLFTLAVSIIYLCLYRLRNISVNFKSYIFFVL